MEPPFKKKTLAVTIDLVFARTQTMLVPVVASQQRIRKQGPFKLTGLRQEHHYFCHVLGGLLELIPELPDFSDDNKIAVMSDYGGEHSDARYSTYSFLFVALNKNGPFQTHMHELRRKHKILDRYSEFKYKDLKFGPRSRALPEYLQLIDNLVHGAVVTVAIDKAIGSVFGSSRSEGHATIAKQLESGDFGKWPGHVGEKAMRVLHILAAFTGALTYDQQRLLWYSDTDQINEDAKDRSFADTQKMFESISAMYMTHGFDVLGFAKSFSEKGYLDDLLSVPDLAAGMLQDLLTARYTGTDIPGGDEKLAVLKWLATPAKFLSKIHLRIARKDDGAYEGQVLTHLFNAMPGLHHREPGMVGAALAHAEYAEIIPDLLHVHPGAIRTALRCIPKLFCVTDSTAAAGMPDGEYMLGRQVVHKCMGGVRLADGTLAGSTLTMDQALRNLVRIGLPIAEASRRVSTYAADYLGEAQRGRLAPGCHADFVVLDRDLQIKTVYIEGEEV